MRRRKLLLGVGALAFLGMAGFVLLIWLTTPTPGVTWENYRRLRRGMSIGDVQALLGEPNQTFRLAGSAATRKDWWDEWDTDVEIHLYFNADRLVNGEAGRRRGSWNLGQTEFLQEEESILSRIYRRFQR
jgi:hypothetical protein